MQDIAFIGGGNMARSLIGGLVKRGFAASRIHVAEPHAPLREALHADFGVNVHETAEAAAQAAGTWLFAVKPQVIRSVGEGLSSLAKAKNPLVISIAAGITTTQLQRWLGTKPAVIRAMPNTPALLGAGVTGLFATAEVSAAQRAQADTLLAAAGKTVWVDDEAKMDAVTGVSGSGPAYVFLLAEAMAAAGVAEGLSLEAAHALTVQTILGAARMLAESGELPAELRRKVTSPNGTTQAAIETFQRGGFEALVGQAIHAATVRGAELSKANDY